MFIPRVLIRIYDANLSMQLRRSVRECPPRTTASSSKILRRSIDVSAYMHAHVLGVHFLTLYVLTICDRDEIQRIKAGNPDITHREAFSAAAKNVKFLLRYATASA